MCQKHIAFYSGQFNFPVKLQSFSIDVPYFCFHLFRGKGLHSMHLYSIENRFNYHFPIHTRFQFLIAFDHIQQIKIFRNSRIHLFYIYSIVNMFCRYTYVQKKRLEFVNRFDLERMRYRFYHKINFIHIDTWISTL